MENYLYDLCLIPEKFLKLFQDYNNAILKAKNNPNTAVRVFAGTYFVWFENQLIELDHLDEGVNCGQWQIKALTSTGEIDWYSDPQPSLKACKEVLNIS